MEGQTSSKRSPVYKRRNKFDNKGELAIHFWFLKALNVTPSTKAKEWTMPLHVTKYERRDSADRNELGLAALEACRSTRENPGVISCRYYWVNTDEIAVLTDAEPGAWGPGSGNTATSRSTKAMFALADLAKSTSNETWAEARAGTDTYNVSQS
jgi:hypothetical protein